MKKITLEIMVVVLMGCGCAVGGPPPTVPMVFPSCQINTSDFTNGASAHDYSSSWNCTFDDGIFNSATVRIFDDGTGFADTWGPFTWKRTSCDIVRTSTSEGDAVISSITINKKTGSGSFFQSGLGIVGMHATCFLTKYREHLSL